MEKNHVVRIICPDQKGLIAAVAGVLYSNGINILAMKEFVETETTTFFARLEIEGQWEAKNLLQQLTAALPATSKISVIPRRKKNIVVMVTKEHHCLGDLLMRHYFDRLQANILAVIGNHDDLRTFTEKFDIPFHTVSHQGISHEEFEQQLLNVLSQYDAEYIVLAKFMRILSPAFVSRYEERIINIHHSFLPAFAGANPYKKAYERGVKLIGATAHIVNNHLDDGPIITQQIIPVKHDDGVRDMIDAGREIEKAVLAEALKLIVEDRIFVSNNKTIVFM